jgi:hypothetical protein
MPKWSDPSPHIEKRNREMLQFLRAVYYIKIGGCRWVWEWGDCAVNCAPDKGYQGLTKGQTPPLDSDLCLSKCKGLLN